MRGYAHGFVSSGLIFVAGSWINIVAYDSFESLLAALLIHALAGLLLCSTRMGGPHERRMFVSVASIGWFMAGVAAVYATFLNDRVQNELDASAFFDLASGGAAASTLEDLRLLTEGAGAVVVWRALYEGLAALGLEKDRYLGVLLNVIAVAFSGVVTVKMARSVHGHAPSRLDRLVLMFSLCGVFWLFAAIHLRDGMVLLGVTLLAYTWVRYLQAPETRNLAILGASTALGLAYLGALRTEFLFVPVAMMLAGLVAILVHHRLRGARRLALYAVALAGLASSAALLWRFRDMLPSAVSLAYEGYRDHSAAQHSSDSLGMALIVDQPLPVRLLLGLPYLYLVPIPVWAGFQLESAYHLFKSLHALFSYALIPLLVLSLWRIARARALRTPAVMFLVFVTVGFSAAIAGTSLESRHLGTFLPSALVLALVPDPTSRADRRAYVRLLAVFLVAMAAVHASWALLKL